MRQFLIGFSLLATLSASASAFDQEAVGAGGLPPIARDYKGRIAAWSRGFYAQPHATRAAALTDPVLIRDKTGRLLWLVCLEAVNDAVSPVPQRYAFGFAPNFFSAPLERRGTTLLRDDCNERPLAWRPFREFGRI